MEELHGNKLENCSVAHKCQRMWLQCKKHTREKPTLFFIVLFLGNWEGYIALNESLNRNPGSSETSWMLVRTQLPLVVSEIFMLIVDM